jgi:peptide/nickel transport system ATP-binding protein
MPDKKKEQIFLSVNNLTVEYTSEDEVVHAVNDVSFELDRGKTLGLVGETGAGKTSIAKAILRILPEFNSRIKSGNVYLNGENIYKKSEKEMETIRGAKISMIFQDPMTALNPVKHVGDQIMESIIIHNAGISKKEAMERAMQMLDTVNIPAERYFEYPHQFSGGMKQRVVIAMALACNPELLLADEPTTALDVTIQAQVLEMIKNLKKQFDTSLILITHDLGVIAEMCDEVAVVYAGEIVEYGSLRDIFKNTAHPYTHGLFDALPDLDKDVDRLKPIKGMPVDPTNLPAGCKFGPRCQFSSTECLAGDISFKQFANGHKVKCLRGESVFEDSKEMGNMAL